MSLFQLKTTRSDTFHTASDISKVEVDKFFDIELELKANGTVVNENGDIKSNGGIKANGDIKSVDETLKNSRLSNSNGEVNKAFLTDRL